MLQPDLFRLFAQLKRHEGSKRNAEGEHTAYRCPAGALTIGYGHNLDANPVPGIAASISEDQADRLLKADVASVMQELERHLPWTSNLSAPRYAVIVNMAFNLGLPRLLDFRNTLALVKRGNYHNAAANMLKSRWAVQVGQRALELSMQMRTGQWQ